MRILGLIPARGGSKGIPRKNIVPVAGKPLLAWTCEAALASTSLSRVVLSTDDEEIAEVGRAWGVEVPFERPAALATDTAASVDVALHALDWLEEHEDWHADVLVLLQPTSPLRTAAHIDEAVALFLAGDVDAVISVVAVPHAFHPWKLMACESGLLVPASADSTAYRPPPRQQVPTLFARNGPAIAVASARNLREARGFYGGRVRPYVMAKQDSVDIDDSEDIMFAEAMLAWRKAVQGGEVKS